MAKTQLLFHGTNNLNISALHFIHQIVRKTKVKVFEVDPIILAASVYVI